MAFRLAHCMSAFWRQREMCDMRTRQADAGFRCAQPSQPKTGRPRSPVHPAFNPISRLDRRSPVHQTFNPISRFERLNFEPRKPGEAGVSSRSRVPPVRKKLISTDKNSLAEPMLKRFLKNNIQHFSISSVPGLHLNPYGCSALLT